MNGAPRIYIQVKERPPTAAPPWLQDRVAAAGGTPFRLNPAFGGQDENAAVSWEELMEFDPQLVIYAIEGQGRAFAPTEFLGIEGWDKTEAAVMRRVYSVDEAFFSTPEPLKALLDEQFGQGPELEHPGLRRLFEPK